MHILYIHQHFAVPDGTTGTRSYEFARRWVLAGHKVTVITGYYDIGGLNYSKTPQYVDGIKVVFVGTQYSNKQSFIRRVISFLVFIILSIVAGLKTKNVDVIYATSTPLTVGIPAMVLKRLKRAPFVFEVRDQWPEIPIELGLIKNSFLIKILLWLEKRIYKSASAIVALSSGMADGVREVIGEDKLIETVPNSSDIDVFCPDIDGANIRKEYGWENKFVMMHFGAMGKVNGLEFLIEVAGKLKEDQNIHFVIIGDGSEKVDLIDKANTLGLKNIEFLSSKSKSELPAFVAACDVSMVIFANYPILEHNSANKFFDSISAGKPILLNYSGWQREIMEDNNAGFGCRLCDIDEFVNKVEYFSSHREEIEKMGQNARRIAEEKFNRDKLGLQLLEVLESVKRIKK